MKEYEKIVWLAPQASFNLADQKHGKGKGKDCLLRWAIHDDIPSRYDLLRVECSDGWVTDQPSGSYFILVLLELLLDAGKSECDREYPQIRFRAADAALGEFEWGTLQTDGTLFERVYVSGLRFSSQHIRKAFGLPKIAPSKVEKLTLQEMQNELNTPHHLRRSTRQKRGRPIGSGSFATKDALLLEAMHSLLSENLESSVNAAAARVAKTVHGQTIETVHGRLRKSYPSWIKNKK